MDKQIARDVRFSCMQIASGLPFHNGNPDEVVKSAQKLYDFVVGDTNEVVDDVKPDIEFLRSQVFSLVARVSLIESRSVVAGAQ